MEFMKLNIQLFASTTISATMSGDSRYTLKLTVSETNVDTVNNTSDVSYTLTLSTTVSYQYGAYNYNGNDTYSISINGVTVASGGYKYDFREYHSLTIKTGTVTGIAHNDDGSKTINISAYVDMTHVSKGSGTANGTLTLTQINRAPNVAVSSYIPYKNSFEISVYTTNTTPLTHVQASYTVNGTNYSTLLPVSNGKITISGLNAKTSYTINLKGHNSTYNTTETTGINVTYTTAPNEITSNSVVIDLNNPDYNTDSSDTWNVGVLANLTYGNGNSINDLYQIVYTFKDPNDSVVGTVTKTLSNYTSYARVAGLLPETTYSVDIDIYTNASYGSTTRRWLYSTYTEFTTLEKFKKVWIKNSQGQWVQGVLYIKTPTGWKPAKRIYIKTGDSTWSESNDD